MRPSVQGPGFVVLAFLIAGFAHAEHPLQHNPFVTPAPYRQASTSQPDAETEPRRWQLKGVMLARKDAGFVNIDGEILTIGQEIDGYTLTAIHARQVVMRKDSIETVIELIEPSSHADE